MYVSSKSDEETKSTMDEGDTREVVVEDGGQEQGPEVSRAIVIA